METVIGKHIHVMDTKGNVKDQGRIIGETPTHLKVMLYSWSDGSEYGVKEFAKDELYLQIYKTEYDMNQAWEMFFNKDHHERIKEECKTAQEKVGYYKFHNIYWLTHEEESVIQEMRKKKAERQQAFN